MIKSCKSISILSDLKPACLSHVTKKEKKFSFIIWKWEIPPHADRLQVRKKWSLRTFQL